MHKSKLKYNISVSHCDLHNLSLQHKHYTHIVKLLSHKSDFDCLNICRTEGGFRVMFMFRFNLNGKLRFIVEQCAECFIYFFKGFD